MKMATTDQTVALIEAIRAMTVEAPNGRPNGKAESEMENVGSALEDGDIRSARHHYRAFCSALADETKALRVAAEGYFGGDFRKPGVRP